MSAIDRINAIILMAKVDREIQNGTIGGIKYNGVHFPISFDDIKKFGLENKQEVTELTFASLYSEIPALQEFMDITSKGISEIADKIGIKMLKPTDFLNF